MWTGFNIDYDKIVKKLATHNDFAKTKNVQLTKRHKYQNINFFTYDVLNQIICNIKLFNRPLNYHDYLTLFFIRK